MLPRFETCYGVNENNGPESDEGWDEGVASKDGPIALKIGIETEFGT